MAEWVGGKRSIDSLQRVIERKIVSGRGFVSRGDEENLPSLTKKNRFVIDQDLPPRPGGSREGHGVENLAATQRPLEIEFLDRQLGQILRWPHLMK